MNATGKKVTIPPQSQVLKSKQEQVPPSDLKIVVDHFKKIETANALLHPDALRTYQLTPKSFGSGKPDFWFS